MTDKVRQREVERLTQQFVERIFVAREQVTLNEIVEGDYPEVFVAFATHKAKKLFNDEMSFQLALPSRYFYNNGEIQEKISLLKEAIISETVFQKKEIVDLSNRAFRFQVDVLIEPRKKLLQLLFAQTLQLKKEDIITILAGFDDRRRLIRELITALQISSIRTFKRDALEKLCLTTETGLFKSTPISTFLSEVGSYIQFEYRVLGAQQCFISSDVMLAMLYEREIGPVYDAFDEECKDKASWTLEEIESSLGRHLLVGAHEYQESRKPGRLSTLKKRKTELEMLQYNFLDDDELDLKPSTTDILNSPESPKLSSSKIKSRSDKSSVVVSDSELIMNIFSNKSEEYHSFMNRIGAIPTWNRAKQEIEKELIERDVSAFASESKLLRELIYSRYFQEST